MKSLVNILEESTSKTALGLRHKMFKKWYSANTKKQWVDLLEINGKGVVDFLRLTYSEGYTESIFRITCDDKVWEWSASNERSRVIFSEQAIYGVFSGSSYSNFTIPFLSSSLTFTPQSSNDIKVVDTDSPLTDYDSFNLLTGGFRFENNFKISMNTNNNSNSADVAALYKIY